MGQCSLFVRRPQLAPVVRTGEQWPHGPTEAVCVRGAGGGGGSEALGHREGSAGPCGLCLQKWSCLLRRSVARGLFLKWPFVSDKQRAQRGASGCCHLAVTALFGSHCSGPWTGSSERSRPVTGHLLLLPPSCGARAAANSVCRHAVRAAEGFRGQVGTGPRRFCC